MKNLILILLVFGTTASCKLTPYTGNDVSNGKALLPREEAPHYKNSLEWWYLTGHLQDKDSDKRYGIEYVFFHFNPRNKNDYLMAHVAVSDPQEQKFYYDYKLEKLSELLKPELPISLSTNHRGNTWTLSGQEGEYLLKAMMGRHPVGIDLRTKRSKGILLHRGNGYETYGDTVQVGYYSYPRLDASGTIILEDKEMEVEGELWYDRQWNCASVALQDVAWDWISIQLENQEELMLYRVFRKSDGMIKYGGSHFAKDETNTYIADGDIVLEELEHWKSPDSKASYPVKWKVSLPKMDYELVVEAEIPHQELGLRLIPLKKLFYWEGMCKVEGAKSGKPVYGKGYVEITNREKAKKADVQSVYTRSGKTTQGPAAGQRRTD